MQRLAFWGIPLSLGVLGLKLAAKHRPGVLQFFAVAAQLQGVLGWGPAPSTIAAIPVAFFPVLGSVTAFFGAKDVWHWAPWVAGVVFLFVPALTMLGGASQFRRGERR